MSPRPQSDPPLASSSSAGLANVTLDDNSDYIQYSDGWADAPSGDPNIDQFFQLTYHGTQTLGANATLTFSGSAIYMYGSMGPNHGSYQVSIDGTFQTLSGYANTTLYQQCLFSTPLNSGLHTVILVNEGAPDERMWLDLDYIVTTVSDNSSFPDQPPLGAISSTVSPSGSSPSPTSSPQSDSSPASSSSTSSSSLRITTALTAIFAVLSILLLLLLLAIYILRRHRKKQEEEHIFRHGNNSNVGFARMAASTRIAGGVGAQPAQAGRAYSPARSPNQSLPMQDNNHRSKSRQQGQLSPGALDRQTFFQG